MAKILPIEFGFNWIWFQIYFPLHYDEIVLFEFDQIDKNSKRLRTCVYGIAEIISWVISSYENIMKLICLNISARGDNNLQLACLDRIK